MMHCDRCNIDFPEGLRYCKWCGQTLHQRRETGELNTCPSCFANVQLSWAFCKACGARLSGQANEPLSALCPRCGVATEPGALNCVKCGEDLTRSRLSRAPQSDSTSILAHCPSCGEPVDSGSMYCKACGSALYEQTTPFGPSALLCQVCHSYSPIGSTLCRVCGVSLTEPATATDNASPPAAGKRRRSSTLPDLEEHMPAEEMSRQAAETEAETDSISSGANTFIFASPGQASGSTPPRDEDQAERATEVMRPKRGADTTVLPGVAGAKSEKPGSPVVSHSPRTTGPVEEEGQAETEDETAKVKPPSTPYATRIDTPSSFFFDDDRPGGNLEAKPESQGSAELPGDGIRTIVLGSGIAAPGAFEGEDHGAASDRKEDAAISRAEVPRDEPTTGDFGSAKSPPSFDETAQTIQLQASAIEIQPAESKPQPEPVTPPVEMASQPVAEPQWEPKREPARPEPAKQEPAKPESFVAIEQPDSKTMAQTTPAAPIVGEKKSGAKAASIIVILLIVAAAGLAVWWFALRDKPAPQAEPSTASTSPQTAPPPAPPVGQPQAPTPTTPEGMVLIQGGMYTIGRGDGSDLEGPEFTVELSSFYIDKTEVTNADYKKFVDATNRPAPTNWTNGSYPQGRDNDPVTGVTWQNAVDYANWAGKRLPTEEEWEAAARGIEKRRYPWGNNWRAGLANIGVRSNMKYDATMYPAEIKPAGQFSQGATPEGIVDLIGNVWEWTAGEVRVYPDSRASLPDNVQQDPPSFRVIRGGAFDGNQQQDASYRGFLEKDASYPKVGFRCVKDAK